MTVSPYDWPLTSLLCDDHQGLGRLAPPLPGLCRDAEDVDGLGLQAGDGVLASAGVEHVHRGRVNVGGVEVVGDLVGCKRRRVRWRKGGSGGGGKREGGGGGGEGGGKKGWGKGGGEGEEDGGGQLKEEKRSETVRGENILCNIGRRAAVSEHLI